MAFVDFVDGATTAHDDFGHGTHVAGIIAGSGWDAAGQYEGVAPGADLLVLRVLNGQGQGSVSDVIRAIDFAVANRARFHVRVINLSIGAAVFESYETDPAHACRQARRGRRPGRRHGRRQPGEGRQRQPAVRRHHRAGQRAVGHHGRRVQRSGHA